MQIKKIGSIEDAPLDLLLVADPSEEAINDYLSRGSCFLAKDKVTIGVFVLLPTRPSTIELVNIAVRQGCQNKGIGSFMLNEAIKIAKSEGYKKIEVGTGNSSISQLAFYQKLGFRITHIEKDFFTLHYHEEIYENGIKCIDMVRLEKECE